MAIVIPDILSEPLAASFFWGASACWVGSEAVIGRKVKRQQPRQSIQIVADRPRPKVLFTLGAAVAILLSFISGTSIMAVSSAALGLGLVIVGIILRHWAIVALGPLFSTCVAVLQNHSIIDSGPYRLIRHPAYLGALISFVGLGLAMGNWLSLATCVICGFWVLSRRIKREERLLIGYFGDSYATYTRGRSRLLPKIW